MVAEVVGAKELVGKAGAADEVAREAEEAHMAVEVMGGVQLDAVAVEKEMELKAGDERRTD